MKINATLSKYKIKTKREEKYILFDILINLSQNQDFLDKFDLHISPDARKEIKGLDCLILSSPFTISLGHDFVLSGMTFDLAEIKQVAISKPDLLECILRLRITLPATGELSNWAFLNLNEIFELKIESS